MTLPVDPEGAIARDDHYGGGPNLLHHLAAGLLDQCQVVLDVGCGRGYLGEIASCEVDGIESDGGRAMDARAWCRRVYELSADDPSLNERLAGPYDALVFIDTLEHFAEPSKVLLGLLPTLADEGHVLAIIPNIAHVSQRVGLLRGKWAYQDEGVLDRTHLRFYTWDTSVELLESVGLDVVFHRAVLAVPRLLRWMPTSIVGRWPNLFGVHTLLLARRSRGTE